MKDTEELRALLANYCGSEILYVHALVHHFVYTKGVQAFAKNAGNGAYWLLDILATEPAIRQVTRDEGFAVALLRVEAGKFTLSVGSDLDGETVVGQVFSIRGNFTDCPAGDWKFYLVYDGERIACLLPSEY